MILAPMQATCHLMLPRAGLRQHQVANCVGGERDAGAERDAGRERSGTGSQPFQTVLRLQNSRMPAAASSRPTPESFTPPKGSSGYEAVMPLTNTAPASIRSMNHSCSSASWLQSAELSPKGGAVGDAQGVFAALGAVDGGDGAEGLLEVETHLRGDALENGGLVEPAVAFGRVAAGERAHPSRPRPPPARRARRGPTRSRGGRRRCSRRRGRRP